MKYTGIPVGLFALLVSVSAVSATGNERLEFGSLQQLLNAEVTTVTAASKYRQDISDAPAAVTIITADEIQKGGYRNLAEALNSVRGLYTLYNRAYHFAGMRGFNPLGDFNTRMLVLVDGYRLNDAVYEQAPMGGDFPVDLDLIDRIEVIHGPGSSLYGTNAFLAVINVVTREGNQVKGGELSSSGGSYNAWTGRASGGSKTANGLDLLVSGSYRDSAGKQRLWFPEYAATNNGIAERLDGERSWDMLAKARWKDFSLIFLHQSRNKEVPTASYESIFNDPGYTIADYHTLAGFLYERHSAVANLNLRLSYNRYEYVGDYPQDYSGVRTVNRDTAVGEWLASDLFVAKNIGNHLLTVGMEHRWQFNQQQQNFDVIPGNDRYLDDNHRSLVQGYYLQDEYHLLPNLILNAGVRADIYDSFGISANPRAALVWKPHGNTVLRLGYSEAFRAPNAYELYYKDGATAKGNPDLKPEKIRSVELGWDQFIGNNIRTTVSGYYTGIDDLVSQVIDPADGMMVFSNKSRVESRGGELQVEGKWENGVSGRLSYSYQDARNLDTGKPLENAPRTVAKAALTVPLPMVKQHFATIETCYGSARLNATGESVAGAAIVNLTLLSRDLVKGLDLSASVYNLLDTRYSLPAGPEQVNSLGESLQSIQQDGITFRVKATWRF